MNLIEDLNKSRHALFESSHKETTATNKLESKIGSWLGHKAVSIISLPLNGLTLLGSVAGFAASACTIGAAKVAVFAVTLGNYELPLSVGFDWFLGHAWEGFTGVIFNAGEIIYDTGDLVYQAACLPRFIAKQLGFDGFFEAIMIRITKFALDCLKKIGKGFEHCFNRFSIGFDKASESEKAVIHGSPYPLNLLDDAIEKERIDFKANDRTVATIAKHYVYSLPDIACNGALALVSAGVSVVTVPAFLCKTSLYAATNIDIPIPTYAGQTLTTAAESTKNVFVDASTDVADIAIILYKISDALGVIKVAKTALEILLYIPKAIFY